MRGLNVPPLMGNHEERLQLNPEIDTNGAITQTLTSDETKDYLLGLLRELTATYGFGRKQLNLDGPRKPKGDR